MSEIHDEEPLKFFCDFGGGVSALIVYDAPEYNKMPKASICPKVEWTGRPTRRVLPRYIEWMHTVNGTIAKAACKSFLYVVQVGPKQADWQKWLYLPDGSRRRV